MWYSFQRNIHIIFVVEGQATRSIYCVLVVMDSFSDFILSSKKYMSIIVKPFTFFNLCRLLCFLCIYLRHVIFSINFLFYTTFRSVFLIYVIILKKRISNIVFDLLSIYSFSIKQYIEIQNINAFLYIFNKLSILYNISFRVFNICDNLKKWILKNCFWFIIHLFLFNQAIYRNSKYKSFSLLFRD